MTNFFDFLYNSIPIRNNWINKIRIYSLFRYCIRTIANIILPLYFRLTAKNNDYKLQPCTKEKGRYIVSLTSFPTRINKLWLVIETILHQTKKPDMIILWLSKEQFPTLDSLPQSLLSMRKRGLQIYFQEGDIRSHKKYYYAMMKYPNDVVITIDDDIYYRNDLLHELIQLSLNNPRSIISNFTKTIKYLENGELASYLKWERTTSSEKEDNTKLQLGIGGVLYPARCLHDDISNITLARELAPTADDIWLFAMANIKGTNIVSAKKELFLPILYSSNVTLSSVNNGQLQNDFQINKIKDYYLLTKGINPFRKKNE